MRSEDIAISARSLTKSYRLFEHPGDRIKQFLGMGLKRYHREFCALKDVSFDIRKGETVGIIGRNGSGKSTLLQLICGILKPTNGAVRIRGNISALLELGAGFNPEFTGRENVFFQGALMGFTKVQMKLRFDEIAAFADIGTFIDHPVRTYSSGMYVRLAFAVQVLSDPEILIIDEALSVGDLFFQQKCLGRIRQLCDNGSTLLFVSHDTSTVRDFCSRAIYLRDGKLQFSGETRTALRQYFSERNDEGTPPFVSTCNNVGRASSHPPKITLQGCVWSTREGVKEVGKGQLLAVGLYDEKGNPSMSFRLGNTMRIRAEYIPAINTPTHVTVEITNKYSQIISSLGSSRLRLTPPETQLGQAIIFEMEIVLQVEAGEYSLVVSLGHPIGPNQGLLLDASDTIGSVVVHWNYEKYPAPFFGMFGLPAKGFFRTLNNDKTT